MGLTMLVKKKYTLPSRIHMKNIDIIM